MNGVTCTIKNYRNIVFSFKYNTIIQNYVQNMECKATCCVKEAKFILINKRLVFISMIELIMDQFIYKKTLSTTVTKSKYIADKNYIYNKKLNYSL